MSTAPLPSSFLKNPIYLESYGVTPSAYGNQLLMIPKSENIASNTLIRLSSNVQSQSIMGFQTPYYNVNTPARQIALFGAILGGQLTQNSKKTIPMRHPFIPGLYAKDITQIVGQALINPYTQGDGDGAISGSQGNNANAYHNQSYQMAEFYVNFESLPYKLNNVTVTNGNTMPYTLNWLEAKSRSANQRITAPIGVYVYQSGIQAHLPALNGRFYTEGLTYLQVVVHRVPEWTLFAASHSNTANANWGNPVFAPYLGTVNKDNVFGCAASTLLFDGAWVEGYGAWWDDHKEYTVTLNFIQIASGVGQRSGSPSWNAELDYTGAWQNVGYIVSGIPPFTPVTFSDNILGALNS